MKSMGIFFTFVRQFSRKNTWKNILQEMKNGLSLRQQQLQVIMIRYNLRNKSPAIPAIHTESFKNTFFNRIVVKYNVAL